MNNKPLGGRGQKAPYKTRIMRVPEPLISQVQQLIDDYRNRLVEEGLISNSNGNE